MNTYGKLLKNLIQVSNSKLSFVAEQVDYDVSYISKWCNTNKLPAGKVAPSVNKRLAHYFSGEILSQKELDTFNDIFDCGLDADNLQNGIYEMLKNSYKDSDVDDKVNGRRHLLSGPRVLVRSYEIFNFFNQELPDMMVSLTSASEVLCTFNIGSFLDKSGVDLDTYRRPQKDVHIKIGLKASELLADSHAKLKQLYFFLNRFDYLTFDFYDSQLMDDVNIIIVKDHLAILCSMDQYHRIITAVVIDDKEQVSQIYQQISPMFKINDLLIHATESEEFYLNGYRTDFYTQTSFQILLTKGFEYLLPPECFASVIRAAEEQTNDDFVPNMARTLQITWAEIFENGQLDFFVLKSSLMKYIEDGEIIFADLIVHLTVEERKGHIQHVLKLIKRNPNIRFYVIDDEYIPNAATLFHTSVFNNHRKLFLKNPNRYHQDLGPHFYSVLSPEIINDASLYMEKLKSHENIYPFDANSLLKFWEKYGSMIYRMLSLSERKQ